MINHPLRFIVLIFLSVILLMAVCCDRHGEADRRMDKAESLMGSKPDSALTILDSITPKMLNSKRGKARYALLKSMALDKNYIDTTTFDVLQPAIDYYLKKGSADEKLRTYYYQGRIYQNRHNPDSAWSLRVLFYVLPINLMISSRSILTLQTFIKKLIKQIMKYFLLLMHWTEVLSIMKNNLPTVYCQ